MQGTNLYIRSNQGFSVLLKDTSTLTLGEPTGFELATLWLPSGHSTSEPLLKIKLIKSHFGNVIIGFILWANLRICQFIF